VQVALSGLGQQSIPTYSRNPFTEPVCVMTYPWKEATSYRGSMSCIMTINTTKEIWLMVGYAGLGEGQQVVQGPSGVKAVKLG
jgi:hypothetical protein